MDRKTDTEVETQRCILQDHVRFAERYETQADRGSELTKLNWSPEDGKAYHQAIARTAELESDHEFVESEAELRVAQPDGSFETKRADIVYDGRHVVDIKTHDASNWSPAEARRQGELHGSQVAGYAASPDLELGTTGTIVHCGREPQNQEAKDAYRDAVEAQGIKLLTPDSAEPKQVVAEIETSIRARTLA